MFLVSLALGNSTVVAIQILFFRLPEAFVDSG